MRKFFKDDAQEEQFLRDGFFIKPLLTEAEVAACIQVFRDTDTDADAGKYNTLEVNNYDSRKKVFDGLNAIIGQKIKDHLIDFKYIGYNFAIKKAHDNDKFQSHRDDMHVDESRFVNVNVWIPLINMSENVGALYIVGNSHKLPSGYRGVCIPFEYAEYEDLIQEHRLSINIPAGNALFFDGRLIHGSPKNHTDVDRPAIITSLIPEEADPIVYLRHPEITDQEVEGFEAPPEFYLRMKINERPEGFKSLGVFPYESPKLSKEEFLEIIAPEKAGAMA